MQRLILDALVTKPVSAEILALYAQFGSEPGWKRRIKLCFDLANANGKTYVAHDFGSGQFDYDADVWKFTRDSWTSSFSRAVRLLVKRGLIERRGYAKDQYLRLVQK
jgi:hypothetical protein